MTAPTSKSDRRSVETRARLLSAASELIAERGWASVSTRDLAARAGVNPALVNYHFGGKSQLLIAGAIESLQTLAGEPGPVFAGTSLGQLGGAAAPRTQQRLRPPRRCG